jgi:hypothetical protein
MLPNDGDPAALHAAAAATAPPVEVQVRTRATPRLSDFPDAAKDLPGGPWRCVGRLTVDPSGMPQEVTFVDCPELLHDAARCVVMRYRLHPYDPADGLGQFELAVNFVRSRSARL